MFTKNKVVMSILAIVVVGTLLGGILVVFAVNNANPVGEACGEAINEWVPSQEADKDLANGTVFDEQNVSFYELAYAKATSAQKVAIDEIIADTSIGLSGEWRRPVLLIIGDLPKDTPRLSVKQAAELFDTKNVDDLESEFNKIAGAPDFVGGSGIGRSIYFLNDDRSEAIILMLGDVFHVVNNDDDGTQTRLPLGTQKLDTSPEPSQGP
jgi:hypothetical protein